MAKKKLGPRNSTKVIESTAASVHPSTPVVIQKKNNTGTQRFNAVIPKKVYNRMKNYADDTGISMKAQMVEAVIKYLEERNY